MFAGTPSHTLTQLWEALADRKAQRVLSPGEILFSSSALANAVYLVEQGRVRLVLSPPLKSGKPFEIAGPGAVLGLSEVMSGSRYNLTAEAAEEVQTSFIERGALLDFLAQQQEYRVHIVRVLSEDLHSLYLRFRSMTPEPRPRKTPNTA